MAAVSERDKDLLTLQNVDIETEITLVSLEHDYKREHWEIGVDEQIGLVPSLKQQGDTAFKAGQYGEAAEHYFIALAYLENAKARDGSYPQAHTQTRISLLLNLSACKLKTADYPAAIEHTSAVLEVDPNNTKALCRRGQAHLLRGTS